MPGWLASSVHVPPVALTDAHAVEVLKFTAPSTIRCSCVVPPVAVIAGVLNVLAAAFEVVTAVCCGPAFVLSRPR